MISVEGRGTGLYAPSISCAICESSNGTMKEYGVLSPLVATRA